MDPGLDVLHRTKAPLSAYFPVRYEIYEIMKHKIRVDCRQDKIILHQFLFLEENKETNRLIDLGDITVVISGQLNQE